MPNDAIRSVSGPGQTLPKWVVHTRSAFPPKRPFSGRRGLAASCQFRKSPSSFDHLVGGREKRRRWIEPERLGCLQIDDEMELSRCLSRQVACTCSPHAPQQPSYSITRSAAVSKSRGIVRLSAAAVLRLRTNSNFVGNCTGRSLGFSPRKILTASIVRPWAAFVAEGAEQTTRHPQPAERH